jgi:hypothetical protein
MAVTTDRSAIAGGRSDGQVAGGGLRALWFSLRAKPTIKDMPLREQVYALIKRPLDATYKERLVIVIDGLDECTPSDGARLLSTLVVCLSGFSIKLLVSSRSDPAIVRSFEVIPHTPIHLQEQPIAEVAKDVRLYWEHSLDDLCRFRRTADWRLSVSLDHLVKITGHLFIYAATILKIVQNTKHDPIEGFTELLEKSNYGTSFTKTHEHSLLDDLYFRILAQAVSDNDGKMNSKYILRLRAILELVIFARHPLTTIALSQLLNIEESKLGAYLATLVSVLVVPDTTDVNGVIRPLHQSFPDFVCRQGGRVHPDLAINAVIANTHITEHCLARLSKDLHFDMFSIQDPSLFNEEVPGLEGRLREYAPEALRYSCKFWTVHCLERTRALGPQCEMPLGLLQFCHTHLLHWIELLSLIDGLSDTLRIMPTLLAELEVNIGRPS